ncbi:50S ribosomal protein L31 [Candidatus Woesebacteria bacterium]|nr:50S ribosomal protein L31 [Candidatus Woesebacteria bacterium]|tara:strand:+ start:185 stop:496 length:312 start_codon:yes stop_codon:yes gene_type:complete
MKASIHPDWHSDANVICACGNKFTTGSTLAEIHVEVCSKCHPFFTGKMRYVDTAGRVDKFKEREQAAQTKSGLSKKNRRAAKRKKQIEEERSRPTSLEDLKGR